MIKKILFSLIAFLLLSLPLMAESLNEYKIRIKNDNVNAFYANKISRKYSQYDILNSLIGVTSSTPIGVIRSFVNTIDSQKQETLLNVDNCATKDCVNNILKGLTHD